MFELRNGISTKPEGSSGIPILRISSVRPMRVTLSDVRFLPASPSYDQYHLRDGDLLFTRYNGNAELVGACGVVERPSDGLVYPDKLIRGRVALVDPHFIAIAMATTGSRSSIRQMAKSAAGQIGISGQDLRTIPIPLPPLAEQARLVECVGRTFRHAERIDHLCGELLLGCEAFERAVLAKAFRGELVGSASVDPPGLLAHVVSTAEAGVPG
jgi:type I restriction enzyme S subunit